MKINIKKEKGNWDLGFSLDYQVLSSDFLGEDENGRPQFNTTRTEIGESLYQLKYRQDSTQEKLLAQVLVKSLFSYFEKVSYVIPMPPSKHRSRQPVFEISKEVAKISGVPYLDKLLHKKIGTEQMKDMSDKEVKIKLLEAAFEISDVLDANGTYNVVLVDDLISSGASLEAACRVLKNYKKIGKIFVAVVTRTKNR